MPKNRYRVSIRPLGVLDTSNGLIASFATEAEAKKCHETLNGLREDTALEKFNGRPLAHRLLWSSPERFQ